MFGATDPLRPTIAGVLTLPAVPAAAPGRGSARTPLQSRAVYRVDREPGCTLRGLGKADRSGVNLRIVSTLERVTPGEAYSSSLALRAKAELHAHLNGCVPPTLFNDLLVEAGVVRSGDIVVTRDLMNLEPAHGGLRAYFRPWHLIRRVPLTPDSLGRMVRSAVAHLRDDNITYVELRHSVVHVAAQNGFTVRQTLRWILDSLGEASESYNVDARLIVSLIRHEFLREYMADLLDGLRSSKNDPRLVGIDLAGDEEQSFDPDWERMILAARTDCGLGVTIHAGETGRGENIRWAVEKCRATRIGHGLAAASDHKLLQLLRERNVCVEVCLTSNFLTQRVPDLAQHPVRAFIEQEVPFVLCADNPQMHGKGLTAEYQLFEELFGRRDLIDEMHVLQRRFAFGLEH